MAKKAATAPRKPRVRKRAEPGSKGLEATQCRGDAPDALKPLLSKIEACGGAVIASYREPLAGEWSVLAALPIDRVEPTPFQRDLSEAHAKRLADTIGKLGRYLDPIVAVLAPDRPAASEAAGRVERFWTPNGRHRLEAMARLGARAVMAIVLPDPAIQYKILALNIEKAHNLREKSLEVVRMYRAMAGADPSTPLGAGVPESGYALEFEEPAFATLGICYEKNGRFGGGAYQPILRRVDGWLDRPLKEALKVREGRAAKIERLDARVTEVVKALQAKGFKSPYLRAFAVSRVNYLKFVKTMPPFDEALDKIQALADKFSVEKVRQEDIAATGGPPPEEG